MADYIKLLRPNHWTKNFFVFAGIIFSQNFFAGNLLLIVSQAFICFCLISSAVYIFNDICDRERDTHHPQKSKRLIASGRISTRNACVIATVLTIAASVWGFFLNHHFVLCLIAYLVINMLYSWRLKDTVIIDVFIIASGFYLRALAGAVVIDIFISSWFMICAFLISLFLALSKRRHELVIYGELQGAQREVLIHYSEKFLDQMIAIVSAATVMSYCLYTISQETVLKFQTTNLIYTIPFVMYGIFRYLFLVYRREEGGTPERTLIGDRASLANIFLWIMTVAAVLYL